MPVYGGTNQVYAVTAGTTVPAAFAGVHRNHHFDTIERLHPLLHPLHPGIGLDYSSFFGKMLSSLFFHEKRDITALGMQYLFPLIIIHLSSFRSIPLPKRNVLLSIFRTD